MSEYHKADHVITSSGSAAQKPAAAGARDLIVQACREIVADSEGQKASDRIAAARLMAEMLGIVGKLQSAAIDAGEGAHSEMPLTEIDRQIALLSRKA